jgi:SAM-dependent methyltransferase
VLRAVLKELIEGLRFPRSARESTSASTARSPVEYSAEVFETPDLDAAKSIILNAAPDMTTEQRWEVETASIVLELGHSLGLDQRSTILDYGCGVGRLAKGIIDRYGCTVLGVDISAAMRELAPRYVNSDRFSVCDPETLDAMVSQGFRTRHACACWVLQHCKDPQEDVARISATMENGGRLFVLNSDYRWVPTGAGWKADTVSVEALLRKTFEVIAKPDVRGLVGSNAVAQQSYALLLKLPGSA